MRDERNDQKPDGETPESRHNFSVSPVGAGREVVVEIDELVLHGFEMRDRYAIGEALQFELERLLAGGQFETGEARTMSAERIDAGAFDMTPRAPASDIGAAIARSVHGGLTSWNSGE